RVGPSRLAPGAAGGPQACRERRGEGRTIGSFGRAPGGGQQPAATGTGDGFNRIGIAAIRTVHPASDSGGWDAGTGSVTRVIVGTPGGACPHREDGPSMTGAGT